MAVEENRTCAVGCKHNHKTYACDKFKKMKTDDRWELVKTNKLCFCCLEAGHMSKDCTKKTKCNTDGCPSYHHHLLHRKNNFPKKNNVVEKNVRLSSGKEDESDSCSSADGVIGTVNTAYQKVLMKILPVVLQGPLGSMKVNAYLDEGAAVTLIDQSVAKSLGLQGPKTTLDLGWIDDTGSKDRGSRRVSLEIAGIPESFEDKSDMKVYKLSDVYTKQGLSLPSQPLEMYKISKQWKYLEGLPLPSIDNRKPAILIGQDHVGLIASLKLVEGKLNEPVASYTRLGWVVHGNPKSVRDSGKKIAFCVQQRESDEILHEMVKEQFKLDSLGVMNSKNIPRSKEDARAEAMMEKLSKRVGEHWETGLLWKTNEVTMPESYKEAFRRLRILERDMDKDEDFAKLYCGKIDEYILKGFCHKLSQEEKMIDNGRVRYIAHFGTTNPNKPGKLRLVVDCKAKANGVGLNDCLLQGPDLMTPLISVLARFRSREYGFSWDIREMFHMFKIRDEDKPSQRFLWRGMERNKAPDIYCMDVMMFGAVSSPYQAQWLKNRNAEEFRDEFGETTDVIVSNHYVDDYLDSAATKEDSIKKIQEVTEIHRRGGMEIRLCSSQEVLKEAVPQEVSNNQPSLLFDEEKAERVLGMYWNPKTDDFQYNLRFRTVDERITSGKKIPTKREILKLNASLFDPLGLIGHLTVRGKILMQDVWRTGLGWDDEIGPALAEKWKKFHENLQKIPVVRIPRCYGANISDAHDIQLHVFNDSSDMAMCSVAYFRVTSAENGREKVDTCIIIGKTRVAPLRPQSIPRLEVQAALMGSRLVEFVKDNHDLKINSIHMWSDSKTVLAWLRADDPRRFKPFVSHRLGEIMEHTDVAMWKWVPTKENVADEGTRDAGFADLSPEARFFKGPSFLKMCKEEWQFEKQENLDDVDEDALEIKKTPLFVIIETKFPIDVAKFSRLKRLIRVTAWILRYFWNICNPLNKVNSKWLLLREMEEAEKLWIKIVQKESFPMEYAQLSKGGPVDKSRCQDSFWNLPKTDSQASQDNT